MNEKPKHTVLTSGETNDKLLARFRDEVHDGWLIVLDIFLTFSKGLLAKLLETALDERAE